MSGGDRVRAFFALQPDAGARAALQTVLTHWPAKVGHPVVASNLHLTLFFIGACDAAQLACLHARAGTVAVSPQTVVLDHLGVFEQARVLWVGPRRAPAALGDLVTRLREALAPCGDWADSRRPFRAHVTLSRGVREVPAGLAIEPVRWQASEFVLMVSRHTPAGVRYEVMARYPKDAGMPLSAGASVG